MNTTYADLLLRWLLAKRDMPWNTEPESVRPDDVSAEERAAIVREFRREA